MSTASVKSRRSNNSFDLKRLLTLKFAASCSAAEAIPYSQTDHVGGIGQRLPPSPRGEGRKIRGADPSVRGMAPAPLAEKFLSFAPPDFRNFSPLPQGEAGTGVNA